MIQPDRPNMTIYYGAWALRAGKLGQEYRHTIRIFNTSCCSTTTNVTRTRVTLRCTYTYVARFVIIRIITSHTPMFPSGLLLPGLPVPTPNIFYLSNPSSIACKSHHLPTLNIYWFNKVLFAPASSFLHQFQPVVSSCRLYINIHPNNLFCHTFIIPKFLSHKSTTNRTKNRF